MDTTLVVDISGVMIEPVEDTNGEVEGMGVDVDVSAVGVGLGDGVINGILLSIVQPVIDNSLELPCRKNSTVIAPLAFSIEPPQNALKSS